MLKASQIAPATMSASSIGSPTSFRVEATERCPRMAAICTRSRPARYCLTAHVRRALCALPPAIPALFALFGGWLVLDIANQDSAAVALLGFGKWLMVLSAVSGFGMWVAFMYAEHKDQQSTQQSITKAFQLGLNPILFRDEVVTLVNVACDEGLVK
jgi:hypothetical protein